MYIGGHYVGILVFLSFFSSCGNAITCVHLVLPQLFRDYSSLQMPWKIYRLNKPISVYPPTYINHTSSLRNCCGTPQ